MSVNPITSSGSATAGTTPTTSAANATVTQDEFLKLLVAQLQAQDPLNPQDPTQFTSQLAQFSSLEQLTKVNSGIAGLASQQAMGTQLSAASYIGRTARVEGNEVGVSSGTAGSLQYVLPAASAKTSLNVYDANDQLVQVVDLGSQAAGAHDYRWPATTSGGAAMPDGTYRMTVAAQDASGNPLTASTSVTGTITSIGFAQGQTQVEINGKMWPVGSLENVW